jgi:LmbE family N-acetylglucosaminyl deacetylase
MLMRVLAVGAHPDDVEILCAGTLAHYARQHAAITIAVLTNGDLGAGGPARAATARVRQAEAHAAAQVLGAELVWVGLPDGFLFDTRENRLLVIDVFRRARPDLVFAHHPGDYHPDHRAAGQLVSAARLLAREPALRTGHRPTDRVAPLLLMDTFLAEGAPPPDLWIDVGDTMADKDAMVAAHTSQNTARRGRTGTDFTASMRAQARRRGREIGVAFAEAFWFASAHPPTSVADLQPPGTTLPHTVVREDADLPAVRAEVGAEGGDEAFGGAP